MKYRKFGKTDWNVSALGFGIMRLPIVENDKSRIDETEAIKMIRHAIDEGINYIDTAYPYHGGNSELVLAKALKDGYREKTRIATKLPSWKIEETKDFDKFFNEQLEKLEVDSIDFYLFHTLNASMWKNIHELGALKWAEEKKAEGKIGQIGFSFHDPLPVFKEIIDAYDWDFCQIQYNYMNEFEQAGTEGLEYAAAKGIPVVIMEPLLGGRLAVVPEPVLEIFDTTQEKRKPVDWALQWLWSKPEVTVILSGMSTMQQLEENIALAEKSKIGLLNTEELALFDKVRSKLDELSPIQCTKCEYCLPCPQDIEIPRLLGLFNSMVMHDYVAGTRFTYKMMVKDEQKADNCIACLECEGKCPQHLPISEWMNVIHETVGEGKHYREVEYPA
ncbi:MAG: aldo/keto reductase [Anaerolineaceae bacterium]|nr:aldo/keto reductase [Anaerolineaceae bacterium]